MAICPLKNRIFCLLLVAAAPIALLAQDEKSMAPVSRTYAITHVTIISAPGKKIENGTVIVKDGLIMSAGTGTAVPPEAIVVKADSLYVYAGFIDGFSRTGVIKPKEETSRERLKDPGNPPPERAGIMPQTDVRNLINPNEGSIADMRDLGFTVAQVVPYGTMLPGTGAIILLAGSSADKMVLVPNTAFYSELTSNQGAYPSTVIGVISKWHELYRQASDAMAFETTYATNRSGLERPANDRILQSFFPVISKKQPVLFRSEKALDVHRIMALQSDLGFLLSLGNVKEGWDVVDKIKASRAKVFLSIDLPEEKKEEAGKEKKGEGKKPDSSKVKTFSDLEKAALEKRKAEFLNKYNGQAALFQKQGVVFGFSCLGVKTKDVAGNIRKMIAAGLSEDQALAALTTSPAQLLGLSDRLGTIEPGKIANLVITEKTCFNEKSKVRYVFVDGVMYKPDQESKDDKESAVKDKILLPGKWNMTTASADGKVENKILFKKGDSGYTGTISGDKLLQPVDIKSLELTGKNLKFTYLREINGKTIEISVELLIDGDNFKGTSKTGTEGSVSVEGSRLPEH